MRGIKDGRWPASLVSDDCFHPALTVASAHLVPETRFAFYMFCRLGALYILFLISAVSVLLDFTTETQRT